MYIINLYIKLTISLTIDMHSATVGFEIVCKLKPSSIFHCLRMKTKRAVINNLTIFVLVVHAKNAISY